MTPRPSRTAYVQARRRVAPDPASVITIIRSLGLDAGGGKALAASAVTAFDASTNYTV